MEEISSLQHMFEAPRLFRLLKQLQLIEMCAIELTLSLSGYLYVEADYSGSIGDAHSPPPLKKQKNPSEKRYFLVT